jgi:glycosyltransferase involved in cell wall biosynthesis
MKISVIICTHNPNRDYLERTLRSLRSQTLSVTKWELLLVDNASLNFLNSEWDLSWQPNARHCREDNIGLIQARIRGIAETSADIIIFVDDDNILDENYLANALMIASAHPELGCWGSSCIRPVFETEPDNRLLPYTAMLALRDDQGDSTGNDLSDHKILPYGAGLCCRRELAIKVSNAFKQNPYLQLLGRRGGALFSGEDIQFSYTAIKEGYQVGNFQMLSLLHLIAAKRLELSYLLACESGHAASNVLLRFANAGVLGWSWKEKFRFVWSFLKANNFNKQFFCAKLQGMHAGVDAIENMSLNNTNS